MWTDVAQWNLLHQLNLPPADGHATTLSWGVESELLVGSGALALYSLAPPAPRQLWHRSLANAARLALFCPDASLVASVASNDKLVKLWRRISIGSENIQFDFTYLPHPRPVERMHWRVGVQAGEGTDNVLYTITVDQVLRVWAPVWPHETYILQLWASVDLRASVLGSIGAPGETEIRNAFVLDSHVLNMAAATAVSRVSSDQEDETVQTLVEVARRSPEVIAVFDSRGRMSAWGLESVGCKTRSTTNVFSIVHAEGLEMGGMEGLGGDVRFLAWAGGKGLVVLAHFFDGRIYWLEGRLDHLLDPAPRRKRLGVRGIWSGHKGIIDTMVRTADGNNLLTSTEDNEHILWKQSTKQDSCNLTRQSFLHSSVHGGVRWAVVLDSGICLTALWHHEAHL